MILSEEQQMVRDMARDFSREKLAPFAAEWDRDHRFPAEAISEMASLGFLGMNVPGEWDGAGLDYVSYAAAVIEVAAGCGAVSTIMSVHNGVGCMPILNYGDEAQREKYLKPMARGEWIGCFCLTEPDAGSDAASIRTRARREGDHYVINGAKQFISGAGDTDLYVAMVRTGDDGPKGVSTIVVPKDAPGLSFGAIESKMGWHMQSTRQVIFEDCKVPAENVLSGEGAGFRIAMAGLDGGRLNIAACSLGGAQSALDKALAYTAEREAFGKAINQFQALQFKLADMETELQASRMLLYTAASKLDRKAPDAGKWSAMAKRFVTDTGFDVANAALQLHGGYGYLHEYGVEKLVRDLRVHQILEGTNEIMRVIIARHLIGR